MAPAAHLDVAPLLAGLVRDRPAVRVQLDVAGTVGLARAVAEGRLPFAVCSAPPAELGLRFEPLFREPVVAVVAVVAERSRIGRASAERAAPVTGVDLAAEPVIVSEAGCAYRAHVEDAFVAAGLVLDARAEVGSTAAAVAAVRAGLGVALVPGADLAAPPAGTVVRTVADLDLALPLGLVRPRAGEPHSALTSEAIAAVRSAAPGWRP